MNWYAAISAGTYCEATTTDDKWHSLFLSYGLLDVFGTAVPVSSVIGTLANSLFYLRPGLRI